MDIINKKIELIHLTHECLMDGSLKIMLCGVVEAKEKDYGRMGNAEVCGECEYQLQVHICWEEAL